MLLPDNIIPENCIYYNGAIVLEIMQQNKRMKMSELFVEVKKRKNLSFAMMLLCLDWLFLIDSVIVNNEEVILCS